jgi:hypothetical protein
MRAALTLPPVSASKDPADYPLFKGKISRWIWRIYTQRLTPAGRWFAIASAVFVAYGGASLELKAYMLAAYAAAIWWIALSAMILYRPRVKLAVTMPPRVSAGETAQVDLEIWRSSRTACRAPSTASQGKAR